MPVPSSFKCWFDTGTNDHSSYWCLVFGTNPQPKSLTFIVKIVIGGLILSAGKPCSYVMHRVFGDSQLLMYEQPKSKNGNIFQT